MRSFRESPQFKSADELHFSQATQKLRTLLVFQTIPYIFKKEYPKKHVARQRLTLLWLSVVSVRTFFNVRFFAPKRTPLNPLSEHLPPIGLLAHERPRGKVLPYCDLTAELTAWESELSNWLKATHQYEPAVLTLSHCTSILFARASKNLTHTKNKRKRLLCKHFFNAKCQVGWRTLVYSRAHDTNFLHLAKVIKTETQYISGFWLLLFVHAARGTPKSRFIATVVDVTLLQVGNSAQRRI